MIEPTYPFGHDNGDQVKSFSTGFKGMITARADHIHGCNRYYVQPPVEKDNKLVEGCWFDEPDLKTIKKVAKKDLEKPPIGTRKPRGGPHSSTK